MVEDPVDENSKDARDEESNPEEGSALKFAGLRTGSRHKTWTKGAITGVKGGFYNPASTNSGNSSNSGSLSTSQRNSEQLSRPPIIDKDLRKDSRTDSMDGMPRASKRLVRAEANQLRACCSKKDLQSAATASTRRQIQSGNDGGEEMDNILEKALKKILREQVADQKPVRMIKTTVDTWDNEWEWKGMKCSTPDDKERKFSGNSNGNAPQPHKGRPQPPLSLQK